MMTGCSLHSHANHASTALGRVGRRRQQMASQTMCFPGIQGTHTEAAQLITLRRHGFEMSRIDAGTIAAQMINLFPIWNRSVGQTIGDTMGQIQAVGTTPKPDLSIPFSASMSGPDMAPIGLYDGFRAQSFGHWNHGLQTSTKRMP